MKIRDVDEEYEGVGDIYCEGIVNELLDDDEVSAEEEAFMNGYNQS